MKILILGHNGMLGSMITKYFETKNIEIVITNLRYPTEQFFNFLKSFDGDFVINCIASIPQRTNDFQINTDLPIWLCNNIKCKVIHPSTDCESDNSSYGLSKKIASDYIKLYSTNTKIIKTSIIGYEKNSKHSLLEWFLSQEKEAEGYTNAIWNGITTLEWSKYAYNLINMWDSSPLVSTLSTKKISKYELLNIFKKVHNKNIDIIPVSKGHDRSLNGDDVSKDIACQLEEMKMFLGR